VQQTRHPRIVYLPGASGRGAVWRPVAERLARRREPFLVDYPGLSDLPPDPSLQSLSDLTGYVLARLPPEPVDVAALSMGCAVGLRLALNHPERVRRLVLVTTAGGVDARRFGGLDWRPALRARGSDAPRWFLDDDQDLSGRLTGVRAPVLLVFGGRDLVAPVAVGEHLKERLPLARLEIIDDATHDLEEEYPDLLASLIEAHLRR
jgi:pimeloyl-ACP methyl ester carboxylesterase